MFNNLFELIKEKEIRIVDLRFTDSLGKEHHVSMPSHQVDENFLEFGKAFDGSSIAGWQKIHNSDMILKPLPETAVQDPFTEIATLILRCIVIDPATGQNYHRCPRSIAMEAEKFMRASGIADACFIGPEPEFFVFDNVSWEVGMSKSSYEISSDEAAWHSGHMSSELGNKGHRPLVKGGYFPVPPVDSGQDLRTTMALTLEEMGSVVEAFHHEVATAGQGEIATLFNTLVAKSDEIQIIKYVVKMVAHAYGKTATFMPKPLVGDNGNGMHIHLSLSKDGKNLFSGNGYAGLSDEALYFIGGVIRHARALNAFTNPSTNSYKRLVPGFEAPVMLAYSSRNRSASIRIPYVTNPKAARIEVRFPDPSANPYLASAALLMAGLDGIQNKIHPGNAVDFDLYEATAEEIQHLPTVCSSLEQALEALNQNREFLLKGEVFTNSFIDSYIELKMQEVRRLQMTTNPAEFEMYYSV